MPTNPHCIAFAGHTRIAAGPLPDVAHSIRERLDAGEQAAIAVFDTATSEPVDLDLRGTPDAVAARAEALAAARAAKQTQRKPGRPRLGVVAREITLLPRHWDWLKAQPGGASAALRRLVDAARKGDHESYRIRRTQDLAHKFMFAVAGDLPGFEEAARSLYAWDLPRLEEQMAAWPPDVAAHIREIVGRTGEA